MIQRSTRQVNQNLNRKPDTDLEAIVVTVAAPSGHLIPAARSLSSPGLHRPGLRPTHVRVAYGRGRAGPDQIGRAHV